MDQSDHQRLKLDTEPKRLFVVSEPYVMYTAFGYEAVVDVIEKKTKREYYIFISPRSLAVKLESLRQENDGKTTGLEFWLRKKTADRASEYILED
jgi:hypothetical protein